MDDEKVVLIFYTYNVDGLWENRPDYEIMLHTWDSADLFEKSVNDILAHKYK